MQLPVVSRQRGSTLIEVLIALVIIAIGLLGFASLQMNSMQRQEQAKAYQAAVQSLQELSETMTQYADLTVDGNFDFAGLSGSTPAVMPCSPCTGGDLAKQQLYDWYQRMSARLPSPRFAVASQSLEGGRQVTITLTWDATLTGSGASSCSAADSHQCHHLTFWVSS